MGHNDRADAAQLVGFRADTWIVQSFFQCIEIQGQNDIPRCRLVPVDVHNRRRTGDPGESIAHATSYFHNSSARMTVEDFFVQADFLVRSWIVEFCDHDLVRRNILYNDLFKEQIPFMRIHAWYSAFPCPCSHLKFKKLSKSFRSCPASGRNPPSVLRFIYFAAAKRRRRIWEQLKLKELVDRAKRGGIQELIIATNPDIEGEATANYLRMQLKDTIPVITRLAHGLPMGADIEFADQMTLKEAIAGRRNL